MGTRWTTGEKVADAQPCTRWVGESGTMRSGCWSSSARSSTSSASYSASETSGSSSS